MADSPEYFSDSEMPDEEDLMNIPSLRPISPSFSLPVLSEAPIMDSATETSGRNTVNSAEQIAVHRHTNFFIHVPAASVEDELEYMGPPVGNHSQSFTFVDGLTGSSCKPLWWKGFFADWN
ncbi:hypothetical protein B0H17DRAFT_1137669 [Mycena rosella]|uniref:Uncharacterized protein n=1 Tax=Mycena rosella TaxID=1033263 RepID=A0AAD7DBD7_MYCRO|nr:hypothetical protein B0H17DRAFT_1137669 [Mycena rosella]